MNRSPRKYPSALTIATLALGAFLLASCGTRTRPPPPPSVRPPPPVRAVPISPARYMELASSSSLYAIRASELALERSQDARVRAFAEALISDHRGVSAQLSFAGRRLNLLPSAEPTGEHRALIGALTSSTNFDADYRRQMPGVLAKAHALHRNYAQGGTSPTLRPVAEMAEPILRREVEQAERL